MAIAPCIVNTECRSTPLPHSAIYRIAIVLIWHVTSIVCFSTSRIQEKMGKITKGLESILNAGKSFGRGLKNKAVIAGMAAALPFMAANYARANEGVINIDYYVSGVGGSSFRLSHYDGSLEGKDNNDVRFYPMFCPDCEFTAKAVSSIEGEEYIADVRPENSTSSGTVSCSMISKSGVPIVVENAKEYLVIELISGFEGYNVFVNGKNARETSGIDFGTLTGSYGSGETIRTVEITFEKQSGPTIVAPSLDTESASGVSANSATLKGKIIEDGNPTGSEQCEYRFSYWKSGGTTLSTNWSCCVDDGDSFTFGVSGLQSNTAYSFQAEARNSAGASVGDLESFVTSNVVDPDPNVGPGPVTPGGSNTLIIENWIAGYSNEANGKWTLTYVDGALVGKDAKDGVYAKPSSYSFLNKSKIVSVINGPGRFDRYELKVDARSLDNTTNANLQLSVENKNGANIEFATPVAHELRFSFPTGLPKETTFFDSMPITIWEVDPLHRDWTSPVRDVRKIIELNKVANTANTGRLALSQLSGIYNSGIPDSYWVVSTNKKLGDIDNSGIVDVNDYIIVQEFQGFSGSTNVDVAGPRGLGLTDGVVDGFDLYYEYGALSPGEASKINPAPTLPQMPYVIEGFESGALGDDWSKWQWPQWKVVLDRAYAGQYSVRSAAIDDNGSTSLTWKVNECADGEVSFYKRVSSEKGFDQLVFYIDDKEQGRWSGELGWEKASYPISAGNHNFKWTYSKDSSGVYGEDAAWIDEIKVPKL